MPWLAKRGWVVALAVAVLSVACWLGKRPNGEAHGDLTPASNDRNRSAPSVDETGLALFTNANLVLISIDTLRADHLSVYGYHRPTSPRLEDFARQGLVFDRFYHSGGGTLDSHVSMMTSLRPLTHGITPASGRSLEQERVTLAETLKAAGYSTAAFVDDGYLVKKYGLWQGFDVYDDRGGRFEVILPLAQQWLEAHRRERFFLFLHTYDVHSAFTRLPYECPGDYPQLYARGLAGAFDGCRDGRCASELLAWVNAEVTAGRKRVTDVFNREELDYMAALYDGCINYVDARLADLFGLLRSLEAFENTVIVVTSDHGEEFGEHGMLIHDNNSYEEMAHIPLLIRLPGGQLAGHRVRHLAAMVDLMPTLLDLLGAATPEQAQGLSLLPTMWQNRPVQQRINIYNNLLAGRWKMIADKRQFFDLVVDPLERTNLHDPASLHQQALASATRTLVRGDQAAQAVFARTVEPTAAQLSEEERAKLRALGYLQD